MLSRSCEQLKLPFHPQSLGIFFLMSNAYQKAKITLIHFTILFQVCCSTSLISNGLRLQLNQINFRSYAVQSLLL